MNAIVLTAFLEVETGVFVGSQDSEKDVLTTVSGPYVRRLRIGRSSGSDTFIVGSISFRNISSGSIRIPTNMVQSIMGMLSASMESGPAVRALYRV